MPLAATLERSGPSSLIGVLADKKYMAAITHMAHENLRVHACGPIHPGVATPRLFVILAAEKERKPRLAIQEHRDVTGIFRR